MPTSCWSAFSSIWSVFAQLGVEGAQRLVEQKDRRVEDQRARERDALLLAARELRRPPLLESAELHQLERAATRSLISAFGRLARRRPKATLSKTFRCGNSA